MMKLGLVLIHTPKPMLAIIALYKKKTRVIMVKLDCQNSCVYYLKVLIIYNSVKESKASAEECRNILQSA